MRGILWMVVASSVLACRSVGAWAQEGSTSGEKLKPTEFTMLPLGTESGEDDDPALVRASDGSYHLAWLSNRTGNAELFAARSADGLSWGKPVRVTNNDFQDWYPSLLQGQDGTFHLVWMRVTPPPDNFQHLWYNRSADGLNWDPAKEVQITTGAVNDFAPNLAMDAEGNLLVFFSGAVRSKNGTSDLFVVRSRDQGASWEEPRALSTLSTPTDMEVFPWVERRDNGSFMMVFSRHDSTRGANYFHSSTELFFASSTDGLTWDPPTTITSDESVDTLPSFYVDHAGTKWTLLWVSTAMSNPPKGEVVEIDVDNLKQYPDGVTNWTNRIGAGGWSPRVVATGTEGLYLMLSVCRVKGTAKIHSQIYQRSGRKAHQTGLE